MEYVGEVSGAERDGLLRGAKALLNPIRWPEPFGLVMIEALACGTPVIAFRRGSVPEIISDGQTGFLVDSVEAAAQAVGRIAEIDRHVCRETFERRFSARRMAQDYVEVYRRLASRESTDVQNFLLPGVVDRIGA